MINPDHLISVMRAAGEPNRLRMLMLCRTRRVAVSEFAQVLGISEPSVSRHIKLLEEAGLVWRARAGQRVYFKVVGEGALGTAGAALLDQIDPTSTEVHSDQQDLLALRGLSEADSRLRASRLGRALAACAAVELRSGAAPRRACILRLRHAELLTPLLELPVQLQVIVDTATERVQLQRWLLAQEVTEGRLRFAERGGLRTSQRFELVIADCGDVGTGVVNDVLSQAAAQLAPNGSLWLFTAYEALDSGARGEHPLLQLRRLLARVGLQSERLQPIEADGAHLLFSVARPNAQSLRAAI